MTGSGFDIAIEARIGSLRLEAQIASDAGTVVIVGPNGAGKSSLLAVLLGTLPLARGRIAIGGKVLADTSAGIDVPVELRRLGYVPQHYALMPHMTVRQNADFALACAAPQLDRRSRAQRIAALFARLELDALADRRPAALSGGERQRAALARALVIEPRALLLDEPLAALDARARREMRGLLAEHLQRLPVPAMVVTHDAADVRAFAGHVKVLEAGRIVQSGTFAELTANPATPFVAELVGR